MAWGECRAKSRFGPQSIEKFMLPAWDFFGSGYTLTFEDRHIGGFFYGEQRQACFLEGLYGTDHIVV